MAIRVKVQNNGVGEELQAKLGALGMEIVFEEDDVKDQEPKDKKTKEKKSEENKKHLA